LEKKEYSASLYNRVCREFVYEFCKDILTETEKTDLEEDIRIKALGYQFDYNKLKPIFSDVLVRKDINEFDFEKLVYNCVMAELKLADIQKNTINSMELDNPELLAHKLRELSPYYYDTNNIWWQWNQEKCKWVMCDDTAIMVSIIEKCKSAFNYVCNQKIKNKILEACMNNSRMNQPAKGQDSWVQLDKIIYDTKTGESFQATPEYFIVNPIPWKLGTSEDTPIIDKMMTEWVGEKKELLYEIMAYCMIPSYPIHRIFGLIGVGANGKSTFLELLRRLIGDDNICASDIHELINNNFQSSVLYNKLACLMSESNFKKVSATAKIKQLSSGDIISVEFKFKKPFRTKNYAKIIMATNTLPESSDTTNGWYRRWQIIEFPNDFTGMKNPLDDISDEEMENLTLKCLNKLRLLLKSRQFSFEGTIEQRKRDYQIKSNPILLHLYDNYDEVLEGKISFPEFYRECLVFFKEKGLKRMTSRAVARCLRDEGFEVKEENIEIESENSDDAGILEKKKKKTKKFYIYGLERKENGI